MASERDDVDDARRAEILALEAKIDSSNHFEFLGVTPGASPEEVRAAFREASRKFHPDRFFGKDLGPLGPKLDRIFKRLVEANQTLTDPEKRAAYLAANPFVRAAMRASGTSEAPATPKTETQEARDVERRQRLARHPYLAKATKIQEVVLKAKEHVAKEEYSQAFTALTHASQIDPAHPEVKSLLVEVRRAADLARSESSYAHAKEALDRGDENLALQALRAAVSANPLNVKAACLAASLLEKKASGIREATVFAQKAVDAEPTNVDHRLQLGRLLMEAGMKTLAKKHFEEAARINPEHPEVKKQGKKFWLF